MKKIDKLEVTWSGLLKVISTVVSDWKPPRLKGEISYRNDLLGMLREVLPSDVMLEKEYRHRGTTIDIWLKWQGVLQTDELAFELKVNLKKKTEFDRLVGQIEGLDPYRNKVLVVLIGETDPDLLGRLKAKYATQINGDVAGDKRLAIVRVLVPEN